MSAGQDGLLQQHKVCPHTPYEPILVCIIAFTSNLWECTLLMLVTVVLLLLLCHTSIDTLTAASTINLYCHT